jgi:hypothetical protein
MTIDNTLTPIQTVTVGSGGQAAIEFTSIPQTYTDLVIKLSARSDRASWLDYLYVRFNGSSATNYSDLYILGYGTTVESASHSSAAQLYMVAITGDTATASTFGNGEIYIPNYAGSTNKSLSTDLVLENNSASNNALSLNAGLWSQTAAITSVTLTNQYGNFVEHSSVTLYGVRSAGYGAYATGGIISQDETYWYHTFTTSGTFTPTQNLSCDYLVVAGGGGAGGSESGSDTGVGGGGAGGFRTATAQSFTNGTAYTVSVGGGGAGGTAKGDGAKGTNSYISGSGFTTFTSTGGGYSQGMTNGWYGTAGGSGSGSGRIAAGTAGTGNEGGYSPAEGNAGALAVSDSINGTGAGGGGGAGAAGSTGGAGTYHGGNGGIGSYTAISGGATTGAGVLSSGNYYFAGGGGGGAGRTSQNKGAGGIGGGGDGGGNGVTNGTSATVNTGGGGGGGTGSVGSNSTGGAGGSGIVIVRYPK